MLEVDRRIINGLLDGFPICERPYQSAAEQLGLTEEALLARLTQLLEDRTLTRFGPLFDSEKLGGAVTLAAIAVPVERFEEVCQIVNGFHEVAHNYERNHKLNMWFVIAADRSGADRPKWSCRDRGQLTGLDGSRHAEGQEEYLHRS